MIKIALVEDNEDCVKHFKELTARLTKERNEEINLFRFSDGLEFLESYQGEYDMIFLDIEMPHIDGLQVAKKLREVDAVVPLIFVTVMAQLAIKGYEVNAMDFIVKPIAYQNFKMKVEKAFAARHKDKSVVIQLFDNEGTRQYIDSAEIEYVESIGHRCEFHTARGTFHRYISVSKLEKDLAGCKFLRSANSFLLNSGYIRMIKNDSVVMRGGATFPISRARKKKFLDLFAEHVKYLY